MNDRTLQEWLEANARTPSAFQRMAAWLAANEHAEAGTVYAMSKAQVAAMLEDVDSQSRARRLEREALEQRVHEEHDNYIRADERRKIAEFRLPDDLDAAEPLRLADVDADPDPA